MRHIVKVQPLTPEISEKIAKIELAMAAADAEAAKFHKLYRNTIDTLCKAVDPDYEKNQKDSTAMYSAEVKDNCLVITQDR